MAKNKLEVVYDIYRNAYIFSYDDSQLTVYTDELLDLIKWNDSKGLITDFKELLGDNWNSILFSAGVALKVPHPAIAPKPKKYPRPVIYVISADREEAEELGKALDIVALYISSFKTLCNCRNSKVYITEGGVNRIDFEAMRGLFLEFNITPVYLDDTAII